MNRLKHEALSAATWRGHTMGEWLPSTLYPDTRAFCVCSTCGRQIAVDSRPAPNSIDISGAAVAVNCWGKN